MAEKKTNWLLWLKRKRLAEMAVTQEVSADDFNRRYRATLETGDCPWMNA